MNTCDNTDTLPRNPSRFEARSLSGEVGAEVVLELGLPVASYPDWDIEVGIPETK